MLLKLKIGGYILTSEKRVLTSGDIILEREVQQLILRDNNIDKLAKHTDYYISDIEYSNSENGSRFDIVGIKWPSIASIRKKRNYPHISIMELKYGDDSLSGDSGLLKHFQDIEKFVLSNLYKSFIKEVEVQFNQKIKLGLVFEQTESIELNGNTKPEFILIFANHKANSSILNRELNLALIQCPNIERNIDIKIAQSSFVGYGLYANSMIDLKEYMNDLNESMIKNEN